MEKRFTIETAKTDKMMTSATIIVDRETGVQYLYVASGYGGGLSPLLDSDGKPLLARGYEARGSI